MTLRLVPLSLALAGLAVCSTPASARPQSAQAKACSENAARENLKGAQKSAFVKTCLKGPLTAKTPTAPTASSKEAQAVTKPSGVDRTTRSKQCAAEADRKGLTAKDRSAFQLSCLATAGPVSEGETGTKQPKPANQINGIGQNNYTPSATTAKSKSAAQPPAMAKPQT